MLDAIVKTFNELLLNSHAPNVIDFLSLDVEDAGIEESTGASSA